MFKHILIPTDGSELSGVAIANGIKFAKKIHAQVTGLAVTMPYHFFALEASMLADTMDRYTEDSNILAEQRLNVIQRAADLAGVACTCMHIVSEHPYEEIVKVAENRGCDVIFQASHGRRGVRALLMGSETQKVLTHTKIPVLVFR